MAGCLCTCQTFTLVGATPGTTYNFTYNDCSTGVPTTIFVDANTEPTIHYCYTTGNPGIGIVLLTGSFASYNFSINENGFKVINCNDPNDFFYTVTDLSVYVNTLQVIQVNTSTACWYVQNAIICDQNALVTVDAVFDNCETCAQPEPTDLEIDFNGCCGSRFYFQTPAALVSSYGNVNDTYLYTGPPTADAFGNFMYPNQCYYIAAKDIQPSTPRPVAPLPASFGPIIGTYPTGCSSDICSHCFYRLQNCANPEIILISYSNLSQYIGQTITIQNQPGCWTVSETNLSVPTPINVVPIQGHASCLACSPNIKLTPCCGTRLPVVVSNALIPITNAGQTVCIEDIDPFIGCWTISTTLSPVNYTGTYTVGAYTASCQKCVDDGCKTCQPCYLLTDCDGIIDPILVDNDLSSFVGNVMELCPSNLPTVILPNPALGNPVDGTFLPGAIYDLVDCCNLLPTITVNLNIGIYTGQILNIPTLSPTTCWLVRKTVLNIQPYVVLNLTGARVYTSCEICTRNLQTCSQNIPELTECGCFEVTIATNCNGSITLASIGAGYADCESCIGYCYILTDCEGILPDIETEDDLSAYVGDIIKIKTCPDTCWEVQQSTNCPNPVALPVITNTYATCEDCLPPVLPPPPVQLITRRVKPGYYTKGCPPEYTEKISCKFGDTMFNDVASVRYGINICCDHDVDKWWIKKELLNLKAIYDPALDTPVKVCYCYVIVQTAGSTEFKYISCEGDCTTVTLVAGDTRYICSQNWPNALCPESGSLYTIESLMNICIEGQSCEPVIPCYCYSLFVGGEPIITYTLCDGTILTESFPAGITTLCAQENSITVVQGNVKGIIKNGLCTDTESCLVCNCYQIDVTSRIGATVVYVDCDGNDASVSAPFGMFTLCSIIPPVINPVLGTATVLGNCASCER